MRPRRTLLAAAVLLGVGLGGLFDGIVLHQVLQWHHMVSTPTPPTTLANLQSNTLWDGVFHAAAWLVTLAGVLTLLSTKGDPQEPGAGRRFFGGLLLGWGSFNAVEGLINHHLLNLHHVRPGPDELTYDLAFLLSGVLMAAAGYWITRSSLKRDAP